MTQDSKRFTDKDQATDTELSGVPKTAENGHGASAEGSSEPPTDYGGRTTDQQGIEGSTSVKEIAADASSGLPTAQKTSVEALFASTGELAGVDKDEPQEVLAATGNILNSHYSLAVVQSDRSFWWALVAAIAGTVFFLAAVLFLLLTGSEELATVSVIGGAIVELIAGLNFYLYGKTTEQAASHRSSLEKMQRYLLANSIVESLGSQETKDESRARLISAMSEEDRATSRSEDNGKTRSRNKDKAPSQEGRRSPSAQNQNLRSPPQ
jgi:uncharacterized membrane protein